MIYIHFHNPWVECEVKMEKLEDKNIKVRNSNMKSRREPRTRVITLRTGLLEMRMKLVKVSNNKVSRIWEKKTRAFKIYI